MAEDRPACGAPRLLRLPDDLLHRIFSWGLLGAGPAILTPGFHEAERDGAATPAAAATRAACRRMRDAFDACAAHLSLQALAEVAPGAPCPEPKDLTVVARRMARRLPLLHSVHVRGTCGDDCVWPNPRAFFWSTSRNPLPGPTRIWPNLWPSLLPPDVLCRLRRLDLESGVELHDGHACALAECRALVELRVATCRLTSLVSLSRCTALESLELVFAKTDKNARLDLSHLAPCTGLATLRLAGFVAVPDLCPLSTSLTSLHVSNCLSCHKGQDLSQLLPLTQLSHLAVELFAMDPPAGQPTAAELLSSLPRLTALDIVLDSLFAPEAYLPTLGGLAGQIRHLALTEGWVCPKLELAAMPAAAALQTLRLIEFNSFSDLGTLDTCKALTRLEVHSIRAEGLKPISTLTTLERLHIHNIPSLKDISPLATLSALQELSLRECPSVTELGPLTSLQSLGVLCIGCCHCGDVRSCKHLAGVQGLDLLLEARPGLCVRCADWWLALPPV